MEFELAEDNHTGFRKIKYRFALLLIPLHLYYIIFIEVACQSHKKGGLPRLDFFVGARHAVPLRLKFILGK